MLRLVTGWPLYNIELTIRLYIYISMTRPRQHYLKADMELPLFTILQRTPRVVVTVLFVLFLYTIIPTLYSLFANPVLPLTISPQNRFILSDHQISSPESGPSPASSLSDHSPVPTTTTKKQIRNDEKACDLFTGEWVPNEEAPYYTNSTCWFIHEHQNCMKFGRPDTGFLKWKWKPDGCDLPIFNPNEFLEMVRGKSMGFVGDSISRNQVQSLLCLLSRIEYPEDISTSPDTNFKVWNYRSYNFTLYALWSPFLVKSTKADSIEPDKSNLFNLYLDEYDTEWTSKINQLDYLVISAGHWFFRPIFFYENQQISGCQYCGLPNVTELPLDYGYTKAVRTSLRAVLKSFTGIAFLRTFTPQHFEGGRWNEGADCTRTRPYRRNVTVPKGADLELHGIQLQEFKAAEEEGKKKGLRLRLIDMTQAMLLRPDGHPGRYGHPQNADVMFRNDCIHWCLPGPVDTWNDMLLQMMKLEK